MSLMDRLQVGDYVMLNYDYNKLLKLWAHLNYERISENEFDALKNRPLYVTKFHDDKAISVWDEKEETEIMLFIEELF